MWPIIKPGDVVDVIAPSGKVPAEQLQNIKTFIESWQLVPRIPENLLNDHPYLANFDEIRLQHLHDALYAKDSSLIWCARGGHGTTRLMSEILKWTPPSKQKLLVGFSDITTLHLWLNQMWQWPSLHGPMVRQVAMQESHADDVTLLKSVLFGGVNGYVLDNLRPFNDMAGRVNKLQGEVLGTCLSLLAASLGTPWQINGKGKILVLEDVNELPYRLDRLLAHLANAGVFDQAAAIVLGDFSERKVDECEKALEEVIIDWLPRQNIHVPVFRGEGIGHGARNRSIPLGLMASIKKNNKNYELKFNF